MTCRKRREQLQGNTSFYVNATLLNKTAGGVVTHYLTSILMKEYTCICELFFMTHQQSSSIINSANVALIEKNN